MSNEPTNRSGDAIGAELSVLQHNIGYEFRSRELLQRALTHKSFAKHNNERLEFIGDALLGYLVGMMLYRRDTTLAEDALSLMRSSLVRGTTLAEIGRQIDLAPHLRLGSGERKSGGRQRDSILADAFEALIGAVHEDGGIDACSEVVERLFSARVASLDPENLKDAKTRLQERLQSAQMNLPGYRVVQVAGADHQRRYTVTCEVAPLALACSATASSRRRAEQAAAADMLQALAARDLDGA